MVTIITETINHWIIENIYSLHQVRVPRTYPPNSPSLPIQNKNGRVGIFKQHLWQHFRMTATIQFLHSLQFVIDHNNVISTQISTHLMAVTKLNACHTKLLLPHFATNGSSRVVTKFDQAKCLSHTNRKLPSSPPSHRCQTFSHE